MAEVSQAKPFPLLDLPKEIRLMIYERIPIDIRVHHFENQRYIRPMSPYWLVDRTVSTGIIATCKMIHNEAFAIIRAKQIEIMRQPPRMILDGRVLRRYQSPMVFINTCVFTAKLILFSKCTLSDFVQKHSQTADAIFINKYRFTLKIALRWIRCMLFREQTMRTINIEARGPVTMELGILADIHQQAMGLFRSIVDLVDRTDHHNYVPNPRYALRFILGQPPVNDNQIFAKVKACVNSYGHIINRNVVVSFHDNVGFEEYEQEWCNRSYHRGASH